VVDGVVLPQHPFDPTASPLSADIPLIVGYNRDEATFFNRDSPEVFHMDAATLNSQAHTHLGDKGDLVLATYRKVYPMASPAELYIAIRTAMSFGTDSIIAAERKAAQPAPVYAYRYDYPSNVPIKGTDWTLRAGHATEIAMKFDNSDVPALAGNGAGVAQAARNMSTLWTSFAHDGNPSAKGVPAWPRYDAKRRATMLIDVQCRVVDDPDREIRELWENVRRT
jgi:para-nitrobenzyl esterase